MKEVTVKEEGFAYVYISNESPTLVDVYFDDVVFTRTPSNIVQYNEYYPFGLQASTSWTRENNSNNYLYNDASQLNSNNGWYETMFRGYDATTGRFLQIDPLAHKAVNLTTYQYANNNPLMFNDPMGLQAEVTWADIKSIVSYLFSHGGGTWSRDAWESSQSSDDSGKNNPCPGCMIFGDNANFEYVNNGGGSITIYVTTGEVQVMTGNPDVTIGSWSSTMFNVNLNSSSAEYAGWELGEGTVSYLGDMFKGLEDHYNGGLDNVNLALTGYNKVHNDAKRKFAYNMSRKTNALSKSVNAKLNVKPGQIFQGAKSFTKTTSKITSKLGPAGVALSVGVIGYEVASDTWDAHTFVDGALLVATGAAIIFGGPAVLIGIGVYGVLDYAFDIGDTIDNSLGRKSGLWDGN